MSDCESSQHVSDATADGEHFHARRYGERAVDMEVDFDAAPPVAVTELLAAALRDTGGQSFAENALWAWTLHRRLQGLLAIGIATGGSRGWLEAVCPACRQRMDIELDLSVFIDVPEQRSIAVAPEPGVRASMRLPTGKDQLRWLEGFPDGVSAIRLATDLVEAVNDTLPAADWTVPDAWLDALGEGLEKHDPLTALQLDTECPECGSAVSIEFDLQDYLLRRLMERQDALLDEVHQLAAVYHWSEADILALPSRRRHYYLSRLDRERWP